MTIKNSTDLTNLLLAKMDEVKEGKNLTGAETLCRLVETFIKIKTLEMQYAIAAGGRPSLDEHLPKPANTKTIDVESS